MGCSVCSAGGRNIRVQGIESLIAEGCMTALATVILVGWAELSSAKSHLVGGDAVADYANAAGVRLQCSLRAAFFPLLVLSSVGTAVRKGSLGSHRCRASVT